MSGYVRRNTHNWVDELAALCGRLEIDYIFPAFDDVIVALSIHSDRIPATILTSPLNACLITRSKRATYTALQQIVRVPKCFEDLASVTRYPVIVKPDRGQGSQGVVLVQTPTELKEAVHALSDALICEYLPGEEFTVDCFSDREHGLIFAGARLRKRMRNGIAVNTTTVDIDGVNAMATRIHDTLRMQGAWFFQVKRAADEELTLLEIAPRVAGSMSAHRVQGINFPLLAIYEHERMPIRLLRHVGSIEMDRALRNRFKHTLKFSALYIDLDDTLVLHGRVNLDAVSLIYKCINNEIPVKLLTRHAGNLDVTLKKYRLSGLFDEISHLQANDRKFSFIKESDAILLDDSFSERWEAHHQLGVETFDCSMIELLLNSHWAALSTNQNHG